MSYDLPFELEVVDSPVTQAPPHMAAAAAAGRRRIPALQKRGEVTQWATSGCKRQSSPGTAGGTVRSSALSVAAPMSDGEPAPASTPGVTCTTDRKRPG